MCFRFSTTSLLPLRALEALILIDNTSFFLHSKQQYCRLIYSLKSTYGIDPLHTVHFLSVISNIRHATCLPNVLVFVNSGSTPIDDKKILSSDERILLNCFALTFFIFDKIDSLTKSIYTKNTFYKGKGSLF